MADTTPITDRQRALACNAVSTKANAAGHWLDLETCDAIVDAVIDAITTPDQQDSAEEDRA